MFLRKECYSLIRNKYVWLLVIILSVFTGVIAAQEDISCYHCHTQVVTEFRNNIHYDQGFSCADCHGGSEKSNGSLISNSVMSGDFVGRPTRDHITDICSKCHVQETKDYKTSIHWEQIQKGHPDAATCTDCHGIHEIRAISDPNSSSNHQNSPATCAKCHSNNEMMSAWYYGIKTDRFDTYKESFHWRALDKGYGLVATCADCHENHKTKSHLNPDSSTYTENLPKTCGKENCHAGVNFDVNVATGLVHDKESLHTGELMWNKTGMTPQIREYYFGPFDLAYWIAIFFQILTTAVIGFFTGMVILDFASRLRIKRRF
jgi:hypothetical protein